MPLLLSTKILGPEAVKAARAAGLGYEEREMLKFHYLPVSVQQDWCREKTVWLFTSVNAVKALFSSGMIAVPPSYAVVGMKTEEAIRKHWPVPPVCPAADNAEHLVKALKKLHHHQPIERAVFFCGSRRLDTLPKGLTESGIPVTEVLCYESVINLKLTLPPADVVLFFSPSTVEAYLQNGGSSSTTAIAIGPGTGAALRKAGFAQVLEAERPDWPEMIRLAATHFSKNTHVTE